MHPFRKALDAQDMTAIEDLLADDVVFTSPLVDEQSQGKARVAAMIRVVLRVDKDARYVHEIVDSTGRDAALIFETTAGGQKLTGCDFVHLDDNGKVDNLMVMVRPLSAAPAWKDAFTAEFDRIRQQAN